METPTSFPGTSPPETISGYLWHRDGSSLGRLLPRKRLWYKLSWSANKELVFHRNRESCERNASNGSIDLNGATVYKSSQPNSFRLETKLAKKHLFTSHDQKSQDAWILGLNRVIEYKVQEGEIDIDDCPSNSAHPRTALDRSPSSQPSIIVTSKATEDHGVPARYHSDTGCTMVSSRDASRAGDTHPRPMSACTADHGQHSRSASGHVMSGFDADFARITRATAACDDESSRVRVSDDLNGVGDTSTIRSSPPASPTSRTPGFTSSSRHTNASLDITTASTPSDNSIASIRAENAPSRSSNCAELLIPRPLRVNVITTTLDTGKNTGNNNNNNNNVGGGGAPIVSPGLGANYPGSPPNSPPPPPLAYLCNSAYSSAMVSSPNSECLTSPEGDVTSPEFGTTSPEFGSAAASTSSTTPPLGTSLGSPTSEGIADIAGEEQGQRRKDRALRTLKRQQAKSEGYAPVFVGGESSENSREESHGESPSESSQRWDTSGHKWREAYVCLLQTTLTLFARADDVCVEAIDRRKHKDNLAALLKEARTRDPDLPSMDEVTGQADMHTDVYGFRHRFTVDQRPLLAYACETLRTHYSTERSGSAREERKWRTVLQGERPLTPTVTLKVMCRRGVPRSLRTTFWRRLFYTRDHICINFSYIQIIHLHPICKFLEYNFFQYKTIMDIKNSRGLHYYRRIEQQVDRLMASEVTGSTSENSKQITLDLGRTMPDNERYSNSKTKGIEDLRRVLESFCIHNPVIGYCQGMNFIVAVLLIFLEDIEDTFWALIAITERYFTLNYFDCSLSGALADQKVLKYIIECKLPRLHAHMDTLKVDLSSVTFNWFLTLFYDAVPFATLTRIWDCFFLEGPKVLLRFSVAILRWNEDNLLRQNDMISFLRLLKISTRHMYDVDLLFKLAFESLEPFPRRCELLDRHRGELRSIRGEMLMQNTSGDTSPNGASSVLSGQSALTPFVVAAKRRRNSKEERILGINYGYVYEFAVKWMEKEVWLCETGARNSKIVVIRVDKCSLSTTRIQIDTRIMCSAAMENCFVVGTLSWRLLVYDFRMRKLQWSKDLSDTPLCICATSGYCSERNNCITTMDTTIFVGLANGCLAVCVCKSKHVNEEVEPMYLTIGRQAITSVAMVNKDEYLWASCDDIICVISPKTLEIKHRFSVGPNKQIRSMTYTALGVWVTIRQSQTLTLWSTNGKPYYLSSYEIGKSNPCSDFMHLDDYHSVYEITAIEIFNSMLWIGTADGHLCIYKLKEELKKKLPGSGHPMQLKLPRSKKKFNSQVFSSSEDYSIPDQSSSGISSPSPPPMMTLPLRRVNTEPKRARNPSSNSLTLIMPTNRAKSAAEPRISLVRGSSCKKKDTESSSAFSDCTPLTFSSDGSGVDCSPSVVCLSAGGSTQMDYRGRFTFSATRSTGTASGSSPWDVINGTTATAGDNEYFRTGRPSPSKTTKASLVSKMRISECSVRAIVAVNGRQKAVVTVSGGRGDRWSLLRWTLGKDELWRSSIVKQPNKDN